jgi:hypothetical protein
MLGCCVSVTWAIHRAEHASVGPPVEVTMSAFTGAVIGKKGETEGIVPPFLQTYPKNLREMEWHSQ